MKRDMDLIRLQLMRVEGEEPEPDLAAYSEDQKIYHMALLIEGGLVDGLIRTDGNGYPSGTVAIRLTWSGHEFLDAARNDTIWHKVSKKFKGEGLSIGFELLKTVLIETAKDHLRTLAILPGQPP
jgi:hypothetical protein